MTVLLSACALVLGVLDCQFELIPPIESWPLLVTRYDPLHPELDSFACDEDCSHFADMTAVTPEHYNSTAACIADWLGADVTITGLGMYHCHDRGSAIIAGWNNHHKTWVIHIDLMTDLSQGTPDDAYWLYWDWEVKW